MLAPGACRVGSGDDALEAGELAEYDEAVEDELIESQASVLKGEQVELATSFFIGKTLKIADHSRNKSLDIF